MIELLDDKARRAFTHYKAVALAVKRPAGEMRFALPATHRFDEIKRAKGEGTQRRLGGTSDDHIGHVIADVAQRLADGNRAAGAGVGVRRANAAEAAFNR